MLENIATFLFGFWAGSSHDPIKGGLIAGSVAGIQAYNAACRSNVAAPQQNIQVPQNIDWGEMFKVNLEMIKMRDRIAKLEKELQEKNAGT